MNEKEQRINTIQNTRKDSRLAYFKDNFQDLNEHDEPFDPSQYYYNRQELNQPTSPTLLHDTLNSPPLSPHYVSGYNPQNTSFLNAMQAQQQQRATIQNMNRTINSMNRMGIQNIQPSVNMQPNEGRSLNSPQRNTRNIMQNLPNNYQQQQNLQRGLSSMVQRSSAPMMQHGISQEYQPSDTMLAMAMNKQGMLDSNYGMAKSDIMEKETILQAMQARHRQYQQQYPSQPIPQQAYRQQRAKTKLDYNLPRQQTPPVQQVPNTSNSAMQSRGYTKPTTSDDRFGLLGLMSVIRMTDQDLNVLTLGIDLTTLGLNLNSPEYLYPTFASPWKDGTPRIQPEFKIPTCYFMQHSLPIASHISKFTDETLFYIFYSMPRDVLQAFAAKELMQRKWIYHMELKTWLTPAPDLPLAREKTPQYERGAFIYFDINSWQKVRKDDFVLEYAKIFDPMSKK